jgi:hypothetical protein
MISNGLFRLHPVRVIMKSRKSWFKTKSAKQQADMSEEKSAVAEMVASPELYELTEDEIKIIEGKD